MSFIVGMANNLPPYLQTYIEQHKDEWNYLLIDYLQPFHKYGKIDADQFIEVNFTNKQKAKKEANDN